MTGLILSSSPAAEALIACHDKPESKATYWSFREIAGRKCWYQGHRTVDKAILFWPATRSESAPSEARDDETEKSAVPMTVTAPPVADAEPTVRTIRLRPGTAFEWRWRGLMIELNARAWLDPTKLADWHVF